MSVESWEVEGSLEKAELKAIVEALEFTNFNVSDAARRLRISRSTLYRFMRRLELGAKAEQKTALVDRFLVIKRRNNKCGDKVIFLNGSWFMSDNKICDL